MCDPDDHPTWEARRQLDVGNDVVASRPSLPETTQSRLYGDLRRGRYHDYVRTHSTGFDCSDVTVRFFGSLDANAFEHFLFNLPRYLSDVELASLEAAAAILARIGPMCESYCLTPDSVASLLMSNGYRVPTYKDGYYEWEKISAADYVRARGEIEKIVSEKFNTEYLKSVIWSALDFLVATRGTVPYEDGSMKSSPDGIRRMLAK